MDYFTISEKVRLGQKLNPTEAAVLIRNNPKALASFMIENNPGNVNFTLRKMGYSHLPFEPNPKALARQLQIIIDTRKDSDWNDVVKSFKIDETKAPADFIVELQKQFAK